MSMEALAAFYQRTGKDAHLLAGGVWVGETRLSLMSIPSSLPLRPQAADLRGLLRQTGRVAAVFGCGFETGRTVSSLAVRDRGYGLHSLQRQFRQQVKQALQECRCRPLTWAELEVLALPVNRASVARRGRSDPRFTEPGLWADWCEAAALLPGHEVMGCFVGDELAAYMTTWIHEGTCHGLQMLWSDRYRRAHPTHALYYETVRARLARPEVTAMKVGRQQVPAMAAVDRFKEHAGFVREPCRVGIVLAPALSVLMTHPWSLRMLRALRRRAGARLRGLHLTEVFEVAAETRLL